MAEKYVRVDLGKHGVSEGSPAFIFRPYELYGLMIYSDFDNSAFRSKITLRLLRSRGEKHKHLFLL